MKENRTEYMRNRRNNMFVLYSQIEKEYEEMLNKILEKGDLNKTDWVRKKIQEDYNKL